MLPQQYCLRWKYHHSNLQTMFSQLLDRGCFCDVTLACDGQTLKAHRVVLSACSTYFDSILTNCNSEKDPIIILKDVKFMDIKYLVEFMYKGEINVEHVSWCTLCKSWTRNDFWISRITWLRCLRQPKSCGSKAWLKFHGAMMKAKILTATTTIITLLKPPTTFRFQIKRRFLRIRMELRQWKATITKRTYSKRFHSWRHSVHRKIFQGQIVRSEDDHR